MARETKVSLCDIRTRFEPFSNEELEKLLLPYPDHLHLSEEGNRVYADTISHYIEESIEAFIA